MKTYYDNVLIHHSFANSAAAITRLLAAPCFFSLILGCGSSPPPKPAAAAPAKPAVAKPAAPKPAPPPPTQTVAADAYPNAETAAKAFVAAVAANNSDEYQKAQAWLLLQKSGAVQPVAAIVADEQAPLPARATACKILSRFGPEATSALLDAVAKQTGRVQHVAAEELGRIKPPTKEIVERLIELTRSLDKDLRLGAVMGLHHIGPAAKDSAPRLQELLNNTSEPENIRTAAKEGLKKVNPRKTFKD